VALEGQILALDDANALALLQAFCSAQPAAAVPLLTDPLLRGELETMFDIGLNETVVATKGNLARTALLLLARDQDHCKGIAALVAAPPPKQFFGVVEAAALIPAILIVLQTHLKFERSPDGRWSLKLEKKPTDNALLKDLVKKLLSLT
jgi:hypothetical protein